MKHTNLRDLSEVGISHNPEIKKKVILENGYIPKLTTFGQATFQPNQRVDEHKHDTMYEVFFIQKGNATFVVNGKEITVGEGDTITIEPGELHSQENPFSAPVVWLYFGIATD